MRINTKIDSIIADAIAHRVFPGAVVLVAQDGQLLHGASYGTTTYEADAEPINQQTIYDLASLTKMYTATAALRLIDAGIISLDTPVYTVLSAFQRQAVTIAHLLTHTSGLDIRLSVLREQGAAAIRAATYNAPLQHTPGEVVAYTNVNSLLLGDIVATLTNQSLDRAIDELVLQPLGRHDTVFRPAVALWPRIAPTELDLEWRGGLVHGTVHDESAHALGGVAGHAGLFAPAADVLAFCEAWMAACEGNQKALPLSQELAQHATSNQTSELNAACGLGWMIDRPNFMSTAPSGSYGHTGFTGPAMVCIPSRRLAIVLLSNRVYPRRGPAVHHAVTAAVVEAALAS